jgi:hypothetical protein
MIRYLGIDIEVHHDRMEQLLLMGPILSDKSNTGKIRNISQLIHFGSSTQ